MRTTCWRGVCGGLSVVVFLGVASPVHARDDSGAAALAAAGWTRPATVSGADEVLDGPLVVAARDGDVTVMWGSGRGWVKSRTRQAGRPWGPIRRVGRGLLEDVGIDDSGSVTAVWINRAGSVAAATRPDGGAWSTPRRISVTPPRDGTHTINSDPLLAVSPGGAAVAAWTYVSAHAGPAQRVVGNYRPAGGAWGRPRRITQPPSALQDVAISPRGVPLSLVADAGLRTVRRTDGRWHRVGGRLVRSFDDASVEIGPSGHTLALWMGTKRADGGRTYAAYGARLARGRWRAPVRLTKHRKQPVHPAGGIGASGTAVVSVDIDGGRVRVATWPLGRRPSRARTLARVHQFEAVPVVAASGAGAALWQRRTGRREWTLFGSVRPAGGTWSAGRRIAVGESLYPVDADIWPGGKPVAAWQVFVRRSSSYHARVSWKR